MRRRRRRRRRSGSSGSGNNETYDNTCNVLPFAKLFLCTSSNTLATSIYTLKQVSLYCCVLDQLHAHNIV